jgi:hypothetical protein
MSKRQPTFMLPSSAKIPRIQANAEGGELWLLTCSACCKLWLLALTGKLWMLTLSACCELWLLALTVTRLSANACERWVLALTACCELWLLALAGTLWMHDISEQGREYWLLTGTLWLCACSVSLGTK